MLFARIIAPVWILPLGKIDLALTAMIAPIKMTGNAFHFSTSRDVICFYGGYFDLNCMQNTWSKEENSRGFSAMLKALSERRIPNANV